MFVVTFTNHYTQEQETQSFELQRYAIRAVITSAVHLLESQGVVKPTHLYLSKELRSSNGLHIGHLSWTLTEK